MLLFVMTQLPLYLYIAFAVWLLYQSFKGKYTPLFTLLLLAFFGLITITFNYAITAFSQTKTTATTPPKGADTLPLISPQPAADTSPSTNTIESFESSEEPAKTYYPNEDQIPKPYDQPHTDAHTFQAKGNWEWSPFFIQYLEKQLNWKKSDFGKDEINITYTNTTTYTNEGEARKWLYPGGQIEIKRNGQACCCRPPLSVPRCCESTKLAQTELMLQNTLHQTIGKNKEKILKQIRKCLQ